MEPRYPLKVWVGLEVTQGNHHSPVNGVNKKHLKNVGKNVGPIRYCEPPLQCQSPGVASRTPAIAIAQAACVVHDIDDNNDNE